MCTSNGDLPVQVQTSEPIESHVKGQKTVAVKKHSHVVYFAIDKLLYCPDKKGNDFNGVPSVHLASPINPILSFGTFN